MFLDEEDRSHASKQFPWTVQRRPGVAASLDQRIRGAAFVSACAPRKSTTAPDLDPLFPENIGLPAVKPSRITCRRKLTSAFGAGNLLGQRKPRGGLA
jgi:hypothetical protein